MLGTAYKLLGRLPEAATELEKAITLDPSTPGPLNTLAQVRQAQGDRAEATKLFAKAAEAKKALEARQAMKLGTPRSSQAMGGPATRNASGGQKQ